MIGTGGKYYRIEIAISDPRQKDMWWRESGVAKLQVDAERTARQLAKGGQRVRVVRIDEECVWANQAALVASGAAI